MFSVILLVCCGFLFALLCLPCLAVPTRVRQARGVLNASADVLRLPIELSASHLPRGARRSGAENNRPRAESGIPRAGKIRPRGTPAGGADFRYCLKGIRWLPFVILPEALIPFTGSPVIRWRAGNSAGGADCEAFDGNAKGTLVKNAPEAPIWRLF